MKHIVFLSAFALIGFLSCSQEFDTTKLDQYFDALEKNNKFMGSVAVSQNGNLIFSKTIGYADVESKLKAKDYSKYRIGSISKTFTAALVLKAVETDTLDLNKTIDQYFPTIENADKITIGQLLNHRSGIANFTNHPDYLTWNTEPKSESEMIEIIAAGGSSFKPDTKADYSNSNYVLLTYILEKAFQKSYKEILENQITKPLNLENTYLGGKTNIQNNECKSYKMMGEWIEEPETDISIPLGAGGIVSTASDLVTFSNALFNHKIINEQSLEKMKTLTDNYGMGLFQYPFFDKKIFGHTGGIDGFSSFFGYFPSENISYAIVSNGNNFNQNDISIAVLSAVFDKPFDIPEFKSIELTSEVLDKYLGIYSSTEIPLKITITKGNKTLIAQATGQSSFPLEAISKHTFEFKQAGVVMEFNISTNGLILKQGGGQYSFTKD